jgi:peptidoglycan/LPS O-acetylase OafA/YrhL
LTFYLLVPFLNRLRTLHLLSLFLGTLVLRISAFHILGYDHDPWTYQFFPFEIGLFILGMLGYRFQQRFGNRWLRIEWDGNRWKYFLAVVILLGILVGQAALTERLCRIVGVETGRFITYIFWSLEVGFLFRLFGNFRWDRILGEFSFPIYLIHMAVLDNLLQISELHPLSLQTICFSCIAISGTLSVLLYLFVIRRWDEKRHSLSGFHANG